MKLSNFGQPFQPGDRLADRFTLVEVLGKGGVAQVWLAHDLQLNQEPVACKILYPRLRADERAVADLKREILLARRLRHPNILAVHTFWESERACFIVMEYMPGRDLGEALAARGRPFEVPQALAWLESIAEALDYAHAEGVLHRDVKPGNLLLGLDGAVRLADFGVARSVQDGHARVTGEVTCGTLLYMSPEQLRGGALDPRSDLYSLAATAYTLFSGRPPFHEGHLISQIQLQPPPPIAHLPPALNAVLAEALAKDPGGRPPDCTAFVRLLKDAARSRGPLAPAPAQLPEAPEVDIATVNLPDIDDALQRMRLGLVLCEDGAITPRDLDRALARQAETGEKLGEVLVKLGLTDEASIARALSRQLRLTVTLLTGPGPEPALLERLTPEWALERQCLPLRTDGRAITVAMTDPLNLTTINELEATFGAAVAPVLTTPAALRRAIAAHYRDSMPPAAAD